jgi:[ribosomal protein S5]-alanine N-acetyltransferase
MINAPVKLFTTRLVLRKPELDDAAAIFEAYARDVEVTRFLTWRPEQTPEGPRKFVESALAAWKEGNRFTWTILMKGTSQLMGMIDARITECHANLGYVLARRYWSKGYMTEAVGAVSEWALAQPEIFRVWAVCDIRNAASARVLEKAGMQREGILRRWTILPNMSSEPRDCCCYAKVK